MKFYILGASGFMGSQCAEYLKSKKHTVFTERVDITDLSAMKEAFKIAKPDIVINFAGVRAYPNIDWCEDHKEETTKVNVGGAINAMTAAIDVGAYPIQISSGCIYIGGIHKKFTEEDKPNFLGSFYSRMRVVMQDALKELPVLQVRIRMPISMYSHPRNFIDKIVSYKKVISVPNSVTLVEDLYPALLKLSKLKTVGILNITNDGYLTHKEVLAAYKKIVDPSHTYEPISLKQLESNITKAKRSNCLLDNSKAKSLGLSLPALNPVRLEKLMKTYKKSLSEKSSKILDTKPFLRVQ